RNATTTATAAFFSTCCVSWPPRPRKPVPGRIEVRQLDAVGSVDREKRPSHRTSSVGLSNSNPARHHSECSRRPAEQADERAPHTLRIAEAAVARDLLHRQAAAFD